VQGEACRKVAMSGLDCSCGADVWSSFKGGFEDNGADCADDVDHRLKHDNNFPESDHML
jgi:hypothetical protein